MFAFVPKKFLNYVQKSGCNGFTDGEIYGQTVHFYDENEIEVGKPIQCHIAVNHMVEPTTNREERTSSLGLSRGAKEEGESQLTAEEKAEARQKAIRQYQEEEVRKMQNRNKAKTTKQTTQVQQSLFDF